MFFSNLATDAVRNTLLPTCFYSWLFFVIDHKRFPLTEDASEPTVKRYHYQSHELLKTHLQTFLMAYNFARRLKTLNGLTPYEYICKIWTIKPERFNINPAQRTVGLNTYQHQARFLYIRVSTILLELLDSDDF